MNKKVKRYFSTLPMYVQESIMQSGVTLSTVDEMKQFVKNLNDGAK